MIPHNLSFLQFRREHITLFKTINRNSRNIKANRKHVKHMSTCWFVLSVKQAINFRCNVACIEKGTEGDEMFSSMLSNRSNGMPFSTKL